MNTIPAIFTIVQAACGKSGDFYIRPLLYKPGFKIDNEISKYTCLYTFEKNIIRWKNYRELYELKEKYGWYE